MGLLKWIIDNLFIGSQAEARDELTIGEINQKEMTIEVFSGEGPSGYHWSRDVMDVEGVAYVEVEDDGDGRRAIVHCARDPYLVARLILEYHQNRKLGYPTDNPVINWEMQGELHRFGDIEQHFRYDEERRKAREAALARAYGYKQHPQPLNTGNRRGENTAVPSAGQRVHRSK